MKKVFYILLFVYQSVSSQVPAKLLYKADFINPLDTTMWIVEMESKPGSVSTVHTQNGGLVIDVKGGATVWLNKILKGNIAIEYDRTVLIGGGKNDRLSDFNQFWMANDPANKNLFTRNGKFNAYDNLELYYVGMGGNTNQTTRFRKYHNTGEKPVIKEYLDPAHLLAANKTYHVKILVNKGRTSYWVNNECFFDYEDPSPLTSGYFGFRSTSSRQEIRNFSILRLD